MVRAHAPWLTATPPGGGALPRRAALLAVIGTLAACGRRNDLDPPPEFSGPEPPRVPRR
jgi:hypothetical protein